MPSHQERVRRAGPPPPFVRPRRPAHVERVEMSCCAGCGRSIINRGMGNFLLRAWCDICADDGTMHRVHAGLGQI